MSIVHAGARSVESILEALRGEVALAREAQQQYRKLLLDTAVRLDGKRLDLQRKGDPNAPENWNITQWRAFMQDIPATVGRAWASAPIPPAAQTEPLKEIIRALEEQLAQTQARLAQAEGQLAQQKNAPLVLPPPADAPKERVVPPYDLLRQEISREIGVAHPLMRARIETNRSGTDAHSFYARAQTALYLMGKYGMALNMELDALMGAPGEKRQEAKARSGSLHRALDDLKKAGALTEDMLATINPPPDTKLKVHTFTPAGAQMYAELYHAPPCENDLTRIERAFGEDRDRALGLLSFAMHARKRGYYTCLFPEGGAPLWVGKGAQSAYVAFDEQTFRALLAEKGAAAYCAQTARQRELVAGALQLEGMLNGGVWFADVETVATTPYTKLTNNDPLWHKTG